MTAFGELSRRHRPVEQPNRNPMAKIKSEDYNKAKAALTKAGAKSAAKSHVKHGTDGTCPEDHGKKLLQEARDEFDKLTDDAKKKAGRDAVVAAAKVMGITRW
jgi:hypothetical protein